MDFSGPSRSPDADGLYEVLERYSSERRGDAAMEKIIYNAKVYTMDQEDRVCEAIAIKGNKIVAVGNFQDVSQVLEGRPEKIDAGGRVVLPGFNDAHNHLLKSGISLKYCDLTRATRIDHIIDAGKDYIDSNHPKEGTWILGRGWNEVYFDEKRMPNRYDLDKISTVHPIAFIRTCEHAVVVNSKAIELTGITKDTPQVGGGEFQVLENGEPNGMFKDLARDMIYRAIPEPDKTEIKEYILTALNMATSVGVTSIQTDDFWSIPSKNFKKITEAYEELAEEGKLPVRVYEQCVLEEMESLERFLAFGYKTGYGNDFFKIGPFKMFVDGAMGSRTAYFEDAYSDDPQSFGLPIHSQETMFEMMSRANRSGMNLIAHAIGSKAIKMCFDTYEAVRKANGADSIRPAIIHAQATSEKQNYEFAEKDVIAVVDPGILHDDIHMVEQRIGHERAKHSYNYKTLLENNTHMAISTDWPITPINPMYGIYAAATRKDNKGFPPEGWFSEQAISVYDSVRAYTYEPAYLSNEETRKGTIEVGKLADIVILSDDIFTIDKEKILNVKAALTMVNGEVVYKA